MTTTTPTYEDLLAFVRYVAAEETWEEECAVREWHGTSDPIDYANSTDHLIESARELAITANQP